MSGKTKDVANTSKDNNKSIGEKEIKAQIEQIAEQVNVPKVIMKRVNALKNLQVKLIDIESKFYEELHLLECKYSSLYEPLYEKRKTIINGEYEPNEEETEWKYDDDDDDEDSDGGDADEEKKKENKEKKKIDDKPIDKDLKEKLKLDEEAKNETIKGVPDFWLQTFKSVELIAEMIQEYDEPILKHLIDLRVNLHDKRPYGYTLEFHFNDNEYFTNKILTKTYELRTEADETDPFSYEGPDVVKSKGCTIDWKKGKNVCVRLIKKKQKHKSTGTIRVITKEIKQDSFFNYFDTIDEQTQTQALEKKDDHNNKSDNDESNDKNDESLEAADFEIGHFFKERIIPKAILYFTGEVVDEDDVYDDYDDEDDEDEDDDDEPTKDNDEDDDDDDDDDDEDDAAEEEKKPHQHHHSRNKHGHGHKGCKSPKQHGGEDKNNPPECKNQ